MRSSVRSDLFRLVFSSVSALGILGGILAFVFLTTLGQSMDSERRDFADQAIPVITSALETPLTVLKSVTLPPFESQLRQNTPEAAARLQALLTSFPFFLHIMVIDPTGKVRLSVPDQSVLKEVSLSQNPWFREARAQKKPQFSKVAQNYHTGQAEFTLAYPLEEGWFVFSAVDVKSLLSTGKDWQGERNKEIILVEQTGTYIFHPDQNLVRQQQVDTVFLREKRKAGGQAFDYTQSLGGRIWGVAARPLKETGWYVLARQDQDSYWSTFILMAAGLLAGLGILLGLELFFALGISRKIWTGIEGVAHFAASVGEDDVPKVKTEAHYPEYRQLMIYLEEMADRIQEREVFLKSLVENIPFSFWTINQEGTTLWANEQAIRSGNLVKGSNLQASGLQAEEISFFLGALDRSFQGLLSQKEIRRQGEADIFLVLHAAPVFQNGQFRVQLCFEQDVTPIRQAEQTIRRQVSELEQFTYAASHDLKSPLITIQGFLGGMKGDLQKGRMDRVITDLERVIKAVDRMGSLVTDLLELSRVGRIPGILTPCHMGELLEEAVEMLAGVYSPVEHTIHQDTAFPTLPGDRSRLREVWQNLLENALKYRLTDRPLEVHCGCTLKNSQYEFYLRDNGRGVEESYKEKVFGLFEQLDKNSEGTGIGLALVRKIIEHNGGQVWIESEGKDRGTTVVFTLPMPPEGF